MLKLLPFLCTLYGYPVGARQSLTLKLYSIWVVTIYSSPYIYYRFIRGLFSTASSTLQFDRIALLTNINGLEMVLVIFSNYFHLFALIFNEKTFRDLFHRGKVFNIESKTDKLLLLFSLSDFFFVFFIDETTENLARLISYSTLMFLNHLKIFQYCAILNFNSKEISHLIRLIRPQITLDPAHLVRYHRICALIRKSNSVFGLQILIGFCSLLIDILYITGFVLVLKSLNQISLMFFLYLFHHAVVRAVLFLFFSALVTRTKQLGVKYHTRLFGAVRARSRLMEDHTRVSVLLNRNQPINLSACGFFDYGCPSVAPIVSSIATYLVIIIQYSVMK